MTPFCLGSLKLPTRVLYAPLAGCSDFPFRQMSRRFHQGLIHCEMVKMDALIRHDPYTYRLLDFHSSMHPIAAQLCGSKLQYADVCARMIEDLGFDAVDLNCGCPVDKVTKDGSGSGMLKNPEHIGDMLSKMVSAVQIPVTVKIRTGWDEASICAPEIVQIAEKAGAKAITIHGRTRVQAYKGCANWDVIRDCKQVANRIHVIGNGDVFDAEAALKMMAHTHCDAVLVSRGTMGQPWIAEDILRAVEGLCPIERTILDIRSALLEHFQMILAYRNERQALLDFRRVGCWYLKKCVGVKALRLAINQAKSTLDVMHLIETFSWEEVSLSNGNEAFV